MKFFKEDQTQRIKNKFVLLYANNLIFCTPQTFNFLLLIFNNFTTYLTQSEAKISQESSTSFWLSKIDLKKSSFVYFN